MHPQIGVGVFVIRDGKFLIGRRKGAHGADTWSLPGGKLEFGESPEQTAVREVLEETGMSVTNIRFGAITNDVFVEDEKHFLTLWMLSDWESGEPTITEPDKYIDHKWVNVNNLPSPLFAPWERLLISDFLPTIKQSLLVS